MPPSTAPKRAGRNRVEPSLGRAAGAGQGIAGNSRARLLDLTQRKSVLTTETPEARKKQSLTH